MLRNTFACLVHEQRECVIDLVSNLHHLDPGSRILLYNGGQDAALLQDFPWEQYNAVVHPTPRPMKWGWLHDFALDCFRFGLQHEPFDTMTIVDSDQLGLRPGYSEFLARFLAEHPGAGLLGNIQTPQGPGANAAPAVNARRELDLWRPFLRKFPDGESKFVHWTFWPSTVFTAAAAKDLVALWDSDTQLQEALRRSRIWATEEVIFPTLVALLGYPVLQNPCRYDVVKYRVRYSRAQLDAALADPSVFWAHPIPRKHDDPLRAQVRDHFGGYPLATATAPSTPAEPAPRLLLTWPILAEMRRLEGWLSDVEADLLIAAAARAIQALPGAPALVEVGSYCGKATVVLGRVAEALGTSAPVHAIDPGDGVVGDRQRGLQNLAPTRDTLARNLRMAGLDSRVRVHVAPAPCVPWSEPIGLLLVDGLHDHASASADFHHLEPWLVEGGLVAFHDCADYFPGVQRLVREVLREGRFIRVHQAETLVVLQKRVARPAAPPRPEPRTEVAPPRVTSEGPLVSCILPTHERRAFVPLALRTFLAQDWPRRELLILDDGQDAIADLVPKDSRVRYIRLDRRQTIGAKRNLACQAAAGDVVVHWDDDDWSSPQRLSRQVECLKKSGAEVCGLTRVYYHQPLADRSWQYVYPEGRRPWVAGNSLCYEKSFWRRNPFPDINVGEDARFLWSDPRRRLCVVEDASILVAFIHGANADPKRIHHRFWHPHSSEALRSLMGSEWEDYRRAALGASASQGAAP
ncbi:hypothetical protein DRW03_24350 [Corallococcus sp. H22C18031201]|nr:hypothetical protein DRW03_24350 [Corallococcus sp. H22C18031201]